MGLSVLSGWLPVRPLYLTNDDVAMRLLVEGQFAPGAAPTPFVMFMHIAIGWLLTALYTAVNRVPWYDVLMLVAALATNIALVSAWSGTSIGSRLRALMLSIVLLGPLYATPQFSLIGMTTAAAGLILLIRALTTTAERASAAWASYGLWLFTAGTLIRAEGAVLLLVQAVVSILVASFVRSDSIPLVSGRLLTRATLIAALPLFVLVTNFVAYRSSPGWREFPEFNYVRGMLTEYAPAGGVQPDVMSALTAKTGWSNNDLQLLQGWFFENADVFSLEKLRAALSVIRKRDRSVGTVLAGFVRAAQALLRETWLPMLFLITISASAARPRGQLILTAILLMVFLVVATSASAWLKALPFRVYWPMLVLVGGFAARSRDDSSGPLSAVSLLAAGTLLVFIAVPRWHQQELRAAEARDVRADVIGLSRMEPSLVIIHADALRWEYVWRPFTNSTFPHPFIGIGASARTPPIQAVLRGYGRSDLINTICSDKPVILLARPWLPPSLVVFMREHYSRRVAFEAVFEGRTFTAWRCRADVPRTASP